MQTGGTLTQFNAILVAIHGAAIGSLAGAVRVVSLTALLLHVLAAFILCWAARPVHPVRSTSARMAVMQSRTHAGDTFRNYHRGWRITMIALVASLATLALYLANELGLKLPHGLSSVFAIYMKEA